MPKKYQYYQPVALTEHCLRAEEIAGLFGLFTQSNKPHALLASALLHEAKAPVYYYEFSKGLLKGYLFRDYYEIMMAFRAAHQTRGLEKVTIANKTYRYILKSQPLQKEALKQQLNRIFPDESIMD